MSTLFFTELWERFSFYGLQALLVLHLVLPVQQGGLGYGAAAAAAIYGNYTMSLYILSILGGLAGLLAQWFGRAAVEELPRIFAQQAVLVLAICAALAVLAPHTARTLRALENIDVGSKHFACNRRS